MKKLKDYVPCPMMDGFGEKYYTVVNIEEAWPQVLVEKPEAIKMDDEEFKLFTTLFLHKFPHDWDGKEFMGIKIIRG